MSVTPLESFTPYSTAQPMFTATPQWMSEMDAQRILSYQVYEQIYWNVPETFKLTARGAEDRPIYIPTGRTLIDTTHRYVGKDFSAIIDPEFGTPADQVGLRLAITKLFRRERFYSKYNANKRFGLIRGDWLWHVIGNDLKAPGTRLKIEPLDPAAYFPISHPDDPDKIIGCHIVEQIETKDGWKLKRQTYQRGADPVNNDGSDLTIYNSVAIFDAESWEEFNAKAYQQIKPLTPLPPQITALPVYHTRNIESPGDPFGSSDLRGFERIMAAINQAISDEELALALDGIGLYYTDAGTPKNADGTDGDWVLGPGRVVQVGVGRKFERVSGVSSVNPVQDHLKFLINSLKEASSTPDIAIGKVEVSNVSGVSLLLQMGPMLSKADEREESIAATHDQFLHDITAMWLPAYEQESFDAMLVSGFGDRLPEDRKAKIEEITSIASIPGVADPEWVRAELAKLGYVFDGDVGERAIANAQALAAAIDPFASRMASEADQEA